MGLSFGGGAFKLPATRHQEPCCIDMQADEKKPGPDRRAFFKKSLALMIGGAAAAVPVAAGLLVTTDPIRRKGAAGGEVKVTTLDALPNDGVPRKFAVVADRTDAWNRYLNVPIGAVYLRRTADDKITALNVLCPHAGCFVDYMPDRGNYLCPCHVSSFTIEGKIASPGSPSPRGLDELEVQVRGNEVWVVFQNYQAGRAEKVPVA
jgi:menaquinol-cytochrome c reductase iron-sulfur subunit